MAQFKGSEIRKIVVWFVTGMLALIIAGLAFIYFVPGYSFSLVKSGSMSPAIRTGDMIITRPPAPASIQPGAIVMYQHDTELVTHRVLAAEGTTLVTKGDALQHPDPWSVAITEVKGVYLFKVPFLGYAVNFLHTKLGWFIAILVPAGFIIGLFIKDILKEAFKDDKKTAKNGEVEPIKKKTDSGGKTAAENIKG